jgi:hypothetical protein
MPKIEAADERSGRLKVAVPAELLNRIAAIAEKNGRSTTREVESRLRASLEAEEALTQEGFASTWARAIGRLMTLLADDLAAGSESADEAFASMKAGASALMDSFLDEWRKILGEREIENVERDTREYASNLARELALRVRRAHEPEKAVYNALGEWLRTTQPSLRSLRPEELSEIQAALFLSPEFLEKIAPKQTSDKGKK